jgi:hypothetical protein
MYATQPIVYRSFIFQLNKVEMGSNEIHILCVFLGKLKNEKCMLSLSLELVEVGGYGLPHPCDGPRNSHLFFKRPLYSRHWQCVWHARTTLLYYTEFKTLDYYLA